MAEYIEREFLYDTMNGQDEEFSLIDALDMIDKIPAADVAQVRHGRWDDKYNGFLFECSNCHAQANSRMFKSNLSHCPNCGAKMDGGDDHA